MDSINFVENIILKQSKKLLENKSYLSSLLVLTIGVEILGSFFDKKPLKSPMQSKLRFKKAINILFSGQYSKLNFNNELYESFRNQLAHTLLISSRFKITESNEHLQINDNVIMFNPIIFHTDFEKAVDRLKIKLSNKEANEKKIPECYLTLINFI